MAVKIHLLHSDNTKILDAQNGEVLACCGKYYIPFSEYDTHRVFNEKKDGIVATLRKSFGIPADGCVETMYRIEAIVEAYSTAQDTRAANQLVNSQDYKSIKKEYTELTGESSAFKKKDFMIKAIEEIKNSNLTKEDGSN